MSDEKQHRAIKYFELWIDKASIERGSDRYHKLREAVERNVKQAEK